MYRTFLLTSIIVATVGPLRAQAEMARRITPPDEPVFYDQNPEPKEIKDLAAEPGRVFAAAEHWSGGYTFRSVYYQCDSVALNRLISLYASLNNSALDGSTLCVLIRDDGDQERESLEKSFNRRPEWVTQNAEIEKWWRENRDVHVPIFNCLLRIESHYSRSTEISIPGSQERIRGAGHGPGNLRVKVALEIWIDGQVALRDLEIPQNVRVEAASRIQAFVEAHESDRLGSREAALEERIREMQGELARSARRTAATMPTTEPAR